MPENRRQRGGSPGSRLPVRVVGTAPLPLYEALAQAGIVVDDHAALSLVWYADLSARVWLRSQEDPLAVALLSDPENREDALSDGAVDAFAGIPAQLNQRLRLVLQLSEVWQDRLRHHVDQERRTSSELQSTRDLLGRLIDATPDPVMAADTRGQVIVFNRAAEAALGYDGAWARENMHVSDVYTESTEARRVLAEIRSSPNAIVREMHVRLRTRKGESLPVRLSAAEVYAADGLPIATIGIFEDRSAELSLHRRLNEATSQLIESERRAAAVEGLARATHELNQPLTVAMGALELLELREDLPQDVRPRLERVYDQLERMAAIVRQLGRASRPGALPTSLALSPGPSSEPR